MRLNGKQIESNLNASAARQKSTGCGCTYTFIVTLIQTSVLKNPFSEYFLAFVVCNGLDPPILVYTF
jgi:hypothetical protein